MDFTRLRINKYIPFGLLGVVTLFLMVASLGEKFDLFYGQSPYTSPLAILIWAITGASALFYLSQKKTWRRITVFSLHLSFLLILAGALTTHLTGFSGTIHLRNGESGESIQCVGDATGERRLPFSIRLDQFTLITYPGTSTPMDYQSEITLTEESEEIHQTISMNKIGGRDGYRLFQQSYDPDGKGSTLMVSYDKWGVRITYIGYISLIIALLGVLFDPQSKFRLALKNNSWKGAALLFIALLPNHDLSAQCKTLSPEEAEAFGNILVQYQERITTVNCLAIDFTKKLTGKDHYKEYTATQVLAGWLFSREEWQFEPMFRVKGESQRELIGIADDYAAFTDFFEANGEYKLRSQYLKMGEQNLNSPTLKPLKQLDEKVELIHMLQSGSLLTIFPAPTEQGYRLFPPNNYPVQTLKGEDSLLINNFLPLLYEGYSHGENVTPWIESFIRHQKRQLGDSAPSEWVLAAEKIYLKANHLAPFCYITLSIGLLALSLLFIKEGERNRRFLDTVYRILRILLTLSCLYLTLLVALRGMVSGRLPLSNGHETLLCIAWMAQLFALLLSGRWRITLHLGWLASGFALLTATLSDKDPQITPLMPVLNSPLLSIHVSLMMIAYTLLFFVTLSSLIAVVSYTAQKDSVRLESHYRLNTIILYPALFCLTAGIFLGAVWANVSWGTYWSWDPKETWALISLLVYSFTFHADSLPFFRKPICHHLFLIVAFLFILITYFGVNYFFGGLHSYGA